MYIKGNLPTCDKPHPLPLTTTSEGSCSLIDKPHPLPTSEQGTGNKPHPPLESSGIQLASIESIEHSTQGMTQDNNW